MFAHYWGEFLTVAFLHLLAVASPGPDFAVVVKQSLCRTQKEAIWTSLGIGSGIAVHVTYSLLGLGLLISHSLIAFNILKVVAVGYLVYVGWQCLRARPQNYDTTTQNASSKVNLAAAYKLGFLTNALNPKATLFFVALFAAVISPTTPIAMQACYGAWMAFATALWFIGITLFFSHHRVKRGFARFGHWVERFMGVALFALAGKLASASLDN
jgi:RhtB (resistance to homoserine/threonine) family protein